MSSSEPPLVLTRSERLTLVRLFVSTFCELNAVLMLMPLMTLRLAARGEAAWIIGLFGAALYGAIFVVTPFAAAFTRRAGLRATYAVSGSAPLLAVATIAVTARLEAWFLAAAVLGCFGGLRWVTAEAFVAQVAPKARRGLIIGAYETMVGACFVIGPLLVSATGIEGALPLLVSGALLVAGLACLLGLPALATHGADRSRAAFLRLARERPVLLVAAFIGGMLESAPATFLPVAGLAAGLSAAVAAGLVAVLGVGGFLCQVPVGYLADRRPLHGLLRACLWSALFGALLAWPAAHWPVLLWPVALLWGTATGGLYTLAMITIGHAYSGVALVGATAALVFAYSAGGALGPALAGLAVELAPRWGFATLFCLVAVAGLAQIRTPSPAAPPCAARQATRRVLLVEDNPVNRELAVAMLEQAGCVVETAEDGQQAIECWRHGGYDLILMDCQMPVLDGLAATSSIRAAERESGRARVRIVALTANAVAEDRARCLATGMDDFLAKPFTYAQLCGVLEAPRAVAR